MAGGSLAASVGPVTLSLGTASDPLEAKLAAGITLDNDVAPAGATRIPVPSAARSEEHTSELQSLMRISYAVFCLKKKNNKHTTYSISYLPYEAYSDL